MKKILLLLTMFFLASPSYATMSVDRYLEQKKISKGKTARHRELEKAILEAYIIGVGDGFVLANMTLTDDRRGLIYCEPMILNLTVENYTKILDDTIKEMSKRFDIGKYEISLILLEGLKKTYPCEKK